mmetsp:Transcript_67491/g.137386  ORF Transcript_67491/g.137386 Transcript_67491/m.137386 type:complete len:282 (+) Transcript_67491:2-847(+)
MGGKGMMGKVGSQDKPSCGIVKSFNPMKGFGFIASNDWPTGDIYFKFQGDALKAGSAVSFTLNVRPDGAAQAANVTPALSEGDMAAGSIKTFSDKHGWGFVSVAGQPDIYFKKQDLPADLQILDSNSLLGQEVRFSIHVTPDGKMQMKSGAVGKQGMKRTLGAPPSNTGIIPAYGSKGGMGAAGGAYGDAGAWGESSKRFKGGGKGGAKGGDSLEGVIKSYNPAKGFGFIGCDATGCDVYFKGSNVPPEYQAQPLQGASVLFQVIYMPDGKPQAQTVQIMG